MKRFVQILAVLAFVSLGGMAKAADKPWAIDEVMGKADAPITVIEYSSMTCPHCADFHDKTFSQIKTQWIDTGKVKWILRDLPWDALAQATAMVAHCSGDRYFQFVDTFFRTQEEWARSQNPLASIKSIARIGGMSDDQVTKCLEDRGLLNEINARKDAGMKEYKVESTPSFLINGKLYSGFMPYDEFNKLLVAAK